MSNPSDVEDFLIERAKAIEESERIQKLVKAYKKVTPIVIPVWDTTPDSIQFNDISPEILESGINIYTAPFDDVWTGIYEPGVYDRSTLWKDIHDKGKIAKVMESWKNNKPLSPLFFVRHMSKDKALVADGKHRLTVARYMGCENIPFMVQSSQSDWVKNAIPTAKKI